MLENGQIYFKNLAVFTLAYLTQDAASKTEELYSHEVSWHFNGFSLLLFRQMRISEVLCGIYRGYFRN